MCLHTIILDPSNPGRMYAAISAAGAFRSDDAGETWRPINQGLQSDGIPDPDAEVGHCVHHIAMHPARPEVLFMQKHWDVMRSDDAGESWQEISGNLPTDFGFPIAIHAHEPDTVYVVPITSDSHHFVMDGKLRVYRSRTGGNEWEALTTGLPQKNCYVNVLRDAMAVDSLDRVRHLLRHQRWAGVRVRRRRRQLGAHRPRPAGRAVGRSADAVMIRVILPAHLRALARVTGEVQLEVDAAGHPAHGAGRTRGRGTRCWPAPCGITTPATPAVRPVLSRARRTCPTNRRTTNCRPLSPTAPSRT